MTRLMARRPSLPVPVLLALALGTISFAAAAQEGGPRHRQQARQRVAVATPADSPVTFRGLTITRPPEIEPAPDDQDIYRDGPIRYNDVRDFSPAPYTTSGVQFPYGLDGVGGYGSDLDFGAGQDSALYDRGAGSRP